MPHLSLIERTRIIKLFNEYASRTKPNYTNISRKAMDSLTASTRTINRYISQLGWRRVNTKYCQIMSPVNRLKRFIYYCMCYITYTYNLRNFARYLHVLYLLIRLCVRLLLFLRRIRRLRLLLLLRLLL